MENRAPDYEFALSVHHRDAMRQDKQKYQTAQVSYTELPFKHPIDVSDLNAAEDHVLKRHVCTMRNPGTKQDERMQVIPFSIFIVVVFFIIIEIVIPKGIAE